LNIFNIKITAQQTKSTRQQKQRNGFHADNDETYVESSKRA